MSKLFKDIERVFDKYKKAIEKLETKLQNKNETIRDLEMEVEELKQALYERGGLQ